MAGLYIHIPFCKQRCIYCDFYFVTSQKLIKEFVQALKREIVYQGNFFGPNLKLETIYFGGGTPSLLSTAMIAELLETINQNFDTSTVLESSFELNPDDIDSVYLKDLRNTGMNRLSVGIQSFIDDDLRWMNRAHTAMEADAVINVARAAGFDNFSVDFIFGLPHQTESNWLFNLEKAISLDIPHLSTYNLTIEPRTPLHKRVISGKQPQVSEDMLAHLYLQTIETLQSAGYQHYEVSSFSKPGCRSQHNQRYWQHSNYIGLGPSAHSFWRSPGLPALRWANVSNVKKYTLWDGQEAPPSAFIEEISHTDLANEYIMLRLRTRDGLDLHKLASDYGTTLSNPLLEKMVTEGLAKISASNVLSLTNKGMLLCDSITEKFFR